MNCEVHELPVLPVENYQIREVLRCLLHTIMFNRALGPVRPREVDSELFDLAYVQCGDANVDRKIEEKIDSLCAWVEKHPGKRATVLLSFYEKRYKQALWFSKQEERLYWEQWRMHFDVIQPSALDRHSESTRVQRHAALEEALQGALLNVLRLVNEKKDHIPPVVSSDVVCFPYEITGSSDNDSHFGLDMFKRVMMHTSPPTMLN
mmetsp:Transcript_37025/g.44771  ORF Transcript_37025/g.44771 Transcript_37025/m.44771 type:complete len:206 (+) Transcript_37025:392-1009(+)|eukprot:CAMPEP_0197863446 /NCGR_PEP_ID=MMETSP1438-20131217/40907_1 /TAXON_ID=1461541 /ORGANISM="Pterosperma sp., Strain CCMP1384" /LENGTH=205 /DNA_ID=CAMNT_0043481339 /DNA_START=392 /DNA_END=1009 /DNA_ORIENTATION=+